MKPFNRAMATASFLTAALMLAGCSSGSGDGVTDEQSRSSEQAEKAFAVCDNFSPDAFVKREELATGELGASSTMLLRFLHFTDTHITDDDGQFTNGASVIDPAYPSAQRIHEEYSDEILNSMITEVNKCHAKFPSEFMVATGDITDLTTIAETRRFIDNMDGTFDAQSAFEDDCIAALGDNVPAELHTQLCTRHTGKGLADTESPMPDPESPVYQFQVTRTLQQIADTELAAATGRAADGSVDPTRQTLTRSPGLPEQLRCDEGEGCENVQMDLPWVVAFGNHDGYVRGTVALDTPVNEISQLTGRHFMVNQHEFIDEFFFTKAEPGPIGHGFNHAEPERLNDDNQRNDGYYAFDAGNGSMRMIVMNTVFDGIDPRLPSEMLRNPLAVASGTIDAEQFEWIKAELARAYERKQLAMVFSHHPDSSFVDSLPTSALLPVDVTAAELNAELASWPNMVAWVAGHTHRHKIRPFVVENGIGKNSSYEVPVNCKVDGACKGYWQIETASLLDYPQEQRMIEVYDNGDGSGTLRAPVFGHSLEFAKQLAEVDEGCTAFFVSPEAFTTALTQITAGSGCLGGGVSEEDPASRNVELMFPMPSF